MPIKYIPFIPEPVEGQAVLGNLDVYKRQVVIPGENEMEALALGALRILRGEERVHVFHSPEA